MKFLKAPGKSSIIISLTLIICLTVIVGAGIASGKHEAVARALRTATTHKPESFTELYFSDYSKVPKNLTLGKKYPIQFTISNHEFKNYTYTYQTELVGQNLTRKSKPVTVSVESGKRIRRTTSIFASQPGEQVELIVRVLNKNLTIHYKAKS